eukprot:CAMPEP_0180013896 /NCGR_PEP_ID=MMETSP0984-20121128/17826_1 /TAXON_ID=483367 /ORGANISM="non described non described, Strain CCMP 2436" /LENGTH=379 /DNA_ID=CAMNT_0021936411 /DNA_START=62 /DNA_END=1201 /DNA_ORIENTATION=-
MRIVPKPVRLHMLPSDLLKRRSPGKPVNGVELLNAAPRGYWGVTTFSFRRLQPPGLLSFTLGCPWPILVTAVLYFFFDDGYTTEDGRRFDILGLQGHLISGALLALLLAFRTNNAYDRWWEGRTQWGRLIAKSRDFARQCVSFVCEPELVEALVGQTVAFAVLVKIHLRSERELMELEGLLQPVEIDAIASTHHRPLCVLDGMSENLRLASEGGLLDPITLVMLDGSVTALAETLGACERLKNTKVPFSYVIYLRDIILIWVASLPLALAPVMGWATPFTCAAVTYFLLGIDSVAVSIEDPFGRDIDDLPLDGLTDKIREDLSEILERHRAATARRMAPKPSGLGLSGNGQGSRSPRNTPLPVHARIGLPEPAAVTPEY